MAYGIVVSLLDDTFNGYTHGYHSPEAPKHVPVSFHLVSYIGNHITPAEHTTDTKHSLVGKYSS